MQELKEYKVKEQTELLSDAEFDALYSRTSAALEKKAQLRERLAALALAKVYKVDGVRSAGPVLKKAAFENNAAVLDFNSEGKLVARGNIKGFEVLAGGKWVEASAKLDGNSVVLSAPDAKSKVVGARYLYKGWAKPDVSIFDDAGFPAYPFRVLK